MSFLKDLNEEQKQAASIVDGSALVLAGAGSGKTKTLTSRIAYLVKECNISPRSILAVTFTNKAAREMKKRVVDLIGFEGEQVTVSTFHSFAVRYLRSFGDFGPYTSNFNIYDGDDQKKLISNMIKDEGVNGYGMTNTKIAKRIARLKEEGISVEDYENNASTAFEQNFLEIYSAYQERLTKNDAMDFADILINFSKLIERSDVLQKLQDRFKYFMVDEYQDTNGIQHEIVKRLSSQTKNIFVVGDEDQSIYGFRGADVSKILNFEKDFPNSSMFKLERNYRSTKNILSIANAIIKNNTSSRGKELWTDYGGENAKVCTLDDGVGEARFIVSTIKTLQERGINFRDVAILYRNNSQSRELEEEFIRSRVPYKIFGGMQFYQRKEIKDVMAYLNILKNSKDNLSFLRIVNVPHRGLGKVSINKLKALSEELCNGSLYEALEYCSNLDASASVKAGFQALKSILGRAKEMAKKESVSKVVRFVLDETGYIKSLEEGEERDRVENIEELISSIETIENRDGGLKLEDYLEQISLADTSEDLEEGDNYVKLMTIHNSKGLEFEVVFVVGLEEDLFPSIRSVFNDKDLEEERRLFYVAITRAKSLLYITSARNRMVFRSSTYLREISRFVKEIPTNLVEFLGARKSGPARRGLSAEIESAQSIRKEQEKQQNKVGSIIGFSKGDQVIHASFGVGMVMEVNLDKITVSFDMGEKKFISAVAKKFLRKI